MTIHRIKLKDLNAQFLKQLKSTHADQEVEIAWWVQPKSLNKEVEKHLSEQKFWQLIELLDWNKKGNNEAVIEPLVAQLSTSSVEVIKAFEDRLSEKLYQLDGEKYAKHIGKNAFGSKKYFSVDTFLYARCCVVANGQSFYQAVLKKPKKMPKDLTFSPLLRVAASAYRRKIGEQFNYQPAYIYETFANASAWGNDNLIENIINS